jgi:hypothetical protein
VVTDLKKHTKLKELNLLISKKYHFIYCRWSLEETLA